MSNEEHLALVNKPPIEEIVNFDIVNKPPIDELYHYGVMGMHWGIRRYQNPDGTLTPEGKRRQIIEKNKFDKKMAKKHMKEVNKERRKAANFEKRKARIAKDPEQLRKNMDMFSNEEIANAMQRIDWNNKLADMRNSKIEKGKIQADKILSYGQTLNTAIDFLNSPVGRGVRGQLGLGTKKIFDFGLEDAIAKKRAENELDLEKQEAQKKRGLEQKQEVISKMTQEELEDELNKRKNKS